MKSLVKSLSLFDRRTRVSWWIILLTVWCRQLHLERIFLCKGTCTHTLLSFGTGILRKWKTDNFCDICSKLLEMTRAASLALPALWQWGWWLSKKTGQISWPQCCQRCPLSRADFGSLSVFFVTVQGIKTSSLLTVWLQFRLNCNYMDDKWLHFLTLPSSWTGLAFHDCKKNPGNSDLRYAVDTAEKSSCDILCIDLLLFLCYWPLTVNEDLFLFRHQALSFHPSSLDFCANQCSLSQQLKLTSGGLHKPGLLTCFNVAVSLIHRYILINWGWLFAWRNFF